MSEQLKPCPLCGGDQLDIGITGGATFWVECSSCGSCSASHDDEYDATTAWNNRPGEDALRQQRDELARMVLAVAYLAGMSPNVCQLCLGVRGDHAEQCPAARATAYLHEGK